MQAQHIDTSSGSGYNGSPRYLYQHDATYSNPSQQVLAIQSASCLNPIIIYIVSLVLNVAR